jgi:predicted DNA-binding ArsR family transcriptional regulator
MNNTQLYLAIGLPTLASLCTLTTVIIGWFLSRADLNRLSDKIDKHVDSLRADMGSLNDSLRTEMTALRIEMNRDMVAFRKEVHGDLIMLHERVVKVETRQAA